VILDQLAREADQDRREGHQPHRYVDLKHAGMPMGRKV
jgi:hypothetical protein